MTKARWGVVGGLLVGLLVGGYRVGAQSYPPVQVYGVFSGAPKAVAVETDGYVPVTMQATGTTSITGQTPVANNARTALWAGIDGVLVFRPHANLEDRVSAVVGVTDGSSTSLVAAQGAGVRFCATSLMVSNSSATNVTVNLRDGTAGAVIATLDAAANMGGMPMALAVPLCTTANTALAMDPSAIASTVTVTAIGFKTEL